MVSTLDNSIVLLSSLPLEVAQNVVDRIAGHDNAQTWSIRNKYYAADVNFRIVTKVDEARGAPAVIILVDGQKGMQGIDARALAGLAEADVPLVVGLHFDSTVSADDLDALQEHCIGHGFEYVAVDAKQDQLEEGPSSIARIREALQAHVWPAAEQVKPAPRTNLPFSSNGFEDDFAPFQAATEAEVDYGGDVELVFSQLQGLRERADRIEDRDERLRFAEQVALRFASHFEDDDDESGGIDGVSA